MPSERLQRLAPTIVAALVALLAALSLGTGVLIFRHFQADATATSRLYSGVFGGLNNPRPGAGNKANTLPGMVGYPNKPGGPGGAVRQDDKGDRRNGENRHEPGQGDGAAHHEFLSKKNCVFSSVRVRYEETLKPMVCSKILPVSGQLVSTLTPSRLDGFGQTRQTLRPMTAPRISAIIIICG